MLYLTLPALMKIFGVSLTWILYVWWLVKRQSHYNCSNTLSILVQAAGLPFH